MNNRASPALRPVRWIGCFAFLMLQSVSEAQGPNRVDFAHDIVPILKARCAECHTNGKYKGSLSLDSRAEILKAKAVVPGKSGESELIRRVTHKDRKKRMPPKGEPLSAREIERLRAWIDQGLAWEPGFTFKIQTYVAPLKPRRPELPPARPGRDHPIDRIVDAYFARTKIAAPAPLDDAAFARRAFLDLVGLLPAPEELNGFVRDTGSAKRAALVRRLLAEERSTSDHWLSFWNDLLRNDYTGTGYIDGGRKQITAWLYRSLQDNKPYDRFVRELISPTPDSEGFIRGIKWRGNVNASQVQELQFAQNVGQVFFGVNLKCASCHDSFIDHWKLDDAYSLAAVIADRPLEIHRCDKPLGRHAKARFLFPELGAIDPSLARAKRLEQLAALVTHPENGRFSRTIVNRIWQRLMGHGIVHPVDVMANRPWSEDLLDYLASYLVEQKYDVKQLIEHIATSQIYQARAVPIPKESGGDDYVFRGPELKRLSAEQFMDAIWMLTEAGPNKPAAPISLPAFADNTPIARRLIRAALVRSDALLRSLGRPNREQVVTTRPDQLSTLQALDLSNGRILADTLARGAANLRKQMPKADAEAFIEKVYLQALSRLPTREEIAAARQLVGTPPTLDGLADLLWAVVMLPEFQLVR